jgi:hypothetical protein
MKFFQKIFLSFFMPVTVIIILLASCDNNDDGMLPLPPLNITIDPNSTLYSEINIVGGWMYLDYTDGVEPPSRGVIVYRASLDLFYAYERTPPFKPDSCCNETGTFCTALLVDNYFPFVVDTCTNSKYNILSGSNVSGPSGRPLSMYVCEYYGDLLYIHD